MLNPTLTRRDCLRMALSAGALFIGVPSLARDGLPANGAASDIAVWLRIGADSRIAVLSNAVEMGQGAQTALLQIAAEELGVAVSDLDVVLAPVEPAYFGFWKEYVTGGSATVKGMFDRLRQASAAARFVLIGAAAEQWQVAPASCALESRRVVHPSSGRTIGLGDLASRAAQLPLPENIALKPRSQWRVIGTSVARPDLPAKVRGAAMYGIDVQVAGALVAAIRQAPHYGAKLGDVDEGAALSRPNVSKVVRLTDAVAVVAKDYWSAQTALALLEPRWLDPPQRADAESYRSQLRAALDQEGKIHWTDAAEHESRRSSNARSLGSASRIVAAEYETPLLAHACMEPMNATAEVRGDRATLWVPTQAQSGMKRDVAKALGIAESSVVIHTPLLGGGFGRRLASDYGVQAALIARAAGVPVKLIWSREEDIAHDVYRQAAMARLRAAVNDRGEVTAIRAQLAALGDCTPAGLQGPVYQLPQLLATTAAVPTTIPLGAWRAVEVNHNLFFLESFIDELAIALSRSPLEYRRALLRDQPRQLRVFEAAVRASGMGANAAEGRFHGIAMGNQFGSLCAQVVEISIPAPKTLRVHRVTCAIDCGTAVHPDAVRAQVEGGIAMAISATCLEAIDVRNGAAVQSNFHDYPLLRLSQAPVIDTTVLDSPDAPIGGVGEPPVPPLAPALTNAIFAATGERIRKLPLRAAGWRLA